MSEITVTPCRRMVLVRMVPSPSPSSTLYTPHRQEIAGRAEVLAVGPECQFLKGGETVVLNTLLGVELPDDRKLINEPDILATV